jgi:hypothetical protein
MTLRVTIGIDPGQTGALAVLADGVFERFIDMPTLPRPAGGLQINAATLAAALRGIFSAHPGAHVFAVLEQVGAMPKQGVTSTFRFGESFGVVIGVLGGLGIPHMQVRPDRWKRYLNLAGHEKDVARTVAIQRHPEASGHLQRKKDVGRADALLIATWAEITEQVARAA